MITIDRSLLTYYRPTATTYRVE